MPAEVSIRRENDPGIILKREIATKLKSGTRKGDHYMICRVRVSLRTCVVMATNSSPNVFELPDAH